MVPSLKLTLCLTQDCPLRCRYCYAGPKRRRAMARKTAEDAICMALREAANMGCGVDMGFFGGEPLMEWELLQHCDAFLRRHAADLPVPPRFTVTTNGLFLTQEKADWMAGRGYQLVVSIDGDEPMHNLNRVYPDGSGSHAAAAAALALAGATPGLVTQAACVVTPSNVHMLSSGVGWLAAHHRGMVCLNFDHWAAWNREQLGTAAAQYRLCAGLMCQSFRTARPLIIDTFMSKMHSLLAGGYQACDHCRMGVREICVAADGTLFPCSRLVGDAHHPALAMGSVESGIDRAKQTLFTVHRTSAACLACSFRPHCIHWCGCSNFAGTGDFATPSPAACFMEQSLIQTARETIHTLRQEDNALLRGCFGHLPRYAEA